MFALLILVIFGLGIGYFATQNTGAVQINLANIPLYGVPLYVIVIGSMLLGIFSSWLISMVNSLSSLIKIRGKDKELKELYLAIESLRKENDTLLRENTSLKVEEKRPVLKEQTDREGPNTNPSFLHRVRQSFA